MKQRSLDKYKLRFVRGSKVYLSDDTVLVESSSREELEINVKNANFEGNDQCDQCGGDDENEDDKDNVTSFYEALIKKKRLNKVDNEKQKVDHSESSKIGRLFDRWKPKNGDHYDHGTVVYEIEPSNYGYRSMVTRMQWSGSGLGKHGQGRLFPLATQLKFDRAGLGAQSTGNGSSSGGARITHDVVKEAQLHRLRTRAKKKTEGKVSSAVVKKKHAAKRDKLNRQVTQYFRSLLNGTPP